MGLRFRKTVRFGRLVRLNFSGSGVSLGLGPPGLNVNIGKKGVRKTVGIPGSGLSYQTFTSWQSDGRGKQAASPPQPPLPPPETSSVSVPSATTGFSGRPAWLYASIVAAVVVGCAIYFGGSKSQAPAPASASSAPTTAAPPPQLASTGAPSSPTPTVPAPTAPLTQDEIKEVQTRLKALAFDPGPLDGFSGPLTTVAIKKYEAARGHPQTGNLDRALLEALRRESGQGTR